MMIELGTQNENSWELFYSFQAIDFGEQFADADAVSF